MRCPGYCRIYRGKRRMGSGVWHTTGKYRSANDTMENGMAHTGEIKSVQTAFDQMAENAGIPFKGFGLTADTETKALT